MKSLSNILLLAVRTEKKKLHFTNLFWCGNIAT